MSNAWGVLKPNVDAVAMQELDVRAPQRGRISAVARKGSDHLELAARDCDGGHYGKQS